jgi:SGNH domain (fused to AT3 domains)
LTLNHTIAPLPLFVLDTLGATALAALSFKILGSPIRFTTVLDRFRGPVIAIGFSTSILIGLVVVPAVLDAGSGAVAIAEPGAGPHLLDWRVARNDIPPVPDCLDKPVDQCTVVRGTGPRMLLMGDSTARMWVPAFIEMAKHESLTLSIAFSSGCPWQLGLQYNDGDAITKPCAAHQKDWFARVVPQLDPDIIVLAHQADDDPARTRFFIGPDGTHFNSTSAGFEQELMTLSSHALTALTRPGRQVAIIEPLPLGPNLFDPVACLSSGTAPGDCSYTANAEPTPLEQFYRRLALQQPNITSLDLDRVQCPRLPTCDAVEHNIIVKRDSIHLTATYAEFAWMKVDAVFRKQHLLPAATASGG